jgi:predicted RNase H-like nuclease
MLFIGIDLAWSRRNPSGIAIIEAQKDSADFVHGTATLMENEEIIDYIKTHAGDSPAFIAIDASLVVNNTSGERKAETEMKKMFASYHAVPYPSNRALFQRLYGGLWGEEIAGILEEIGFRHDPYIKRKEHARKFFEVFPHSAMVVIFQLKEILKYKAKKGRSYSLSWQEFETYQSLLKILESQKPSLHLPRHILETNVRDLKGKALKQYEDLLDAIFCAYIAFYYWYEPKRCSVIGNLTDGYIVTPVFLKTQNKD